MVVIETASEREEEERLTSAQWPEKILTRTHLGFSPPCCYRRAPLKAWRLPNSPAVYTSKLREAEKLETYSGSSEYPEKSRRFGQISKLLLLREARL